VTLIIAAVLGIASSGSAAASMRDREQNRQPAAIAEMMDAVNAGDAHRYALRYAPDAVIVIHGSVVLNGRDAIERYEVELLREFPGARLALHSMWQAGGSAVVRYAVTGIASGGRPMGHEGLLFYGFDPSGLVQEEHRYLDSLTPMAQLGLLGAGPARPLPTLPSGLKVYEAEGSPREKENVALATASLAALDAKSEDAFLALFVDGAVLDDLTETAPLIGKRSIKAWFGSWTAAVPDARWESTTVLGVGGFVLVECVVRGTLKGTLGRLSPSDRPFAVHRAAIFQVERGSLVSLSLFMNGKELAEAVGQWPLPR
jgi:ketosteroid isomerase-like protein